MSRESLSCEVSAWSNAALSIPRSRACLWYAFTSPRAALLTMAFSSPWIERSSDSAGPDVASRLLDVSTSDRCTRFAGADTRSASEIVNAMPATCALLFGVLLQVYEHCLCYDCRRRFRSLRVFAADPRC